MALLLKYCLSLISLKIFLASSADPDGMSHYVTCHLGRCSLSEYPLSSLQSLTLCIRETSKQLNTFANSEDPDEMQHNAAFHQGLHCF